jgi:hypothetical protein
MRVETDRLLEFDSAALCAFFPDILGPDIAAASEIVHVLLLRGEELPEPLGHHAIHRPLGTTAEFLCESSRRCVW